MNNKMIRLSSEAVLNLISERLENPVPGHSIQDAIKDLLSNDDLPVDLSFEIGLRSWHLYKRLLEADDYQKQLPSIELYKSMEQRVSKVKASYRRWQDYYDKLFYIFVHSDFQISLNANDLIRCLRRLRDASHNLSTVHNDIY